MASIGGAAAAGIASGFNMGLQSDRFAEDQRRTRVSEQRQADQDARQARLDTQNTDRLAKADAQADDDRAFKALDTEMSDHAVYGAGLAHQYGGAEKIPGPIGSAYATKAQDISVRRAEALRARYAPLVKKERQWAEDTASRIEAGQMSMDELSPADTVRLLQATSRRPVTDFLAPENGGKSVVGQGVADATAGLQTNNPSLMIDGANTLMGPDLNVGIGGVTRDGSRIVSKKLYALVPAPGRQPAGGAVPVQQNPVQGLAAALSGAITQPPAPVPAQPGAQPPELPPGAPAQTFPVSPGSPPQQPAALMPGEDPDTVMPVLEVTARRPDGTEVVYHAPVTKGRGTGADDEVHPGFSIKSAMDRMGRLGTLEAWANTPAARAKIAQGLKELGADSNSFLGAYGAMHGDAKALLPAGAADPTAQKIAAIQKLAKDQGVTFEQAARQLDGRDAIGGTGPLARRLADIENSDLDPEDKAAAKRVAALGVAAGNEAHPTVATGAQAKKDTEAVTILRKELTDKQDALGKATDPKEIQRIKVDIDSLTREIKAKGASVGSSALGGAAPPGEGVGADAVDFWARAVIAGDKDWQVGLSRSKSGSQLIEAVKRRVPTLAKEMGLEPQDMGTTRAQSAALSTTLKELTKRAEAVELFASKVNKDMGTFDSLLDKASTGSPLLLSEPINVLRRKFSDSDLSQLDLAAKQVGAEYERLITGGTLSTAQLHVGAADDAKKLINGDMPPKQARAVMEVMRREMQNAREAAHESQKRITDQMRGLGRGNADSVPNVGIGFGMMPRDIPAAGATPKPAGVRQIKDAAEYTALPPGTEFIDPKGVRRRKP